MLYHAGQEQMYKAVCSVDPYKNNIDTLFLRFKIKVEASFRQNMFLGNIELAANSMRSVALEIPRVRIFRTPY